MFILTFQWVDGTFIPDIVGFSRTVVSLLSSAIATVILEKHNFLSSCIKKLRFFRFSLTTTSNLVNAVFTSTCC